MKGERETERKKDDGDIPHAGSCEAAAVLLTVDVTGGEGWMLCGSVYTNGQIESRYTCLRWKRRRRGRGGGGGLLDERRSKATRLARWDSPDNEEAFCVGVMK